MAAKADVLLNGVLAQLGLDAATSEQIFARIGEIVTELQKLNDQEKIAVPTTGTITERLCEHGLKAAAPNTYRKLKPIWKWVGDFYIEGAPFNTVVTVKSFKAKERLLSSGTGNLLSPTIGFGLFNDKSEWTEQRVASYVFRAFFAIYLPTHLLEQLTPAVRARTNINARPFLRSLGDFIADIRAALDNKGLLDPRKL